MCFIILDPVKFSNFLFKSIFLGYKNRPSLAFEAFHMGTENHAFMENLLK